MPLITREQKSRMIELHLEGLSRDQIASEVGVSAGSVSNVLDEFKRAVANDGIVEASRAYGVLDIVDVLRRLSLSLRELGASAKEALPGTELLKTLKEWHVDFQGLKQFVDEVYEASKKRVLPPDQMVIYSKRLFEISTKTGRSYEQILDESKKLSAQIPIRKGELEKLEGDVKVRKEEVAGLIAEKRLTARNLQEYLSVKDEIATLGLDISYLPKLKNLLVNCVDLGFDPKKVAKYASEVESLEKRKAELERGVESLDAERARLESITSVRKRALDDLEGLVKMGVSMTEITEMHEIVSKSGSPSQAFKAITFNLDIMQLKGEWNQLSSEVEVLKRHRDQLHGEIASSFQQFTTKTREVILALEEAPKVALNGAERISNDMKQRLDKTVQDTTASIEQLWTRVLEIGINVGKYEAVAPLFRIIGGGDAEPEEFLPCLINIMGITRKWSERHPPITIFSQHFTSCLDQFEKSLKEDWAHSV